MKQFGYFSKSDTVCKEFSDLDHGLEWCEEKILGSESTIDTENIPLAKQLIEIFPNQDTANHFMKYLKELTFSAGSFVFHQGDVSDSLYLIESGRVTILLELSNREELRLGLMGAGTVFGEMGLYTGEPRSATVFVEKSSVLYCLSYESFKKMQAEDPKVAICLHQYIVRLLSERLAHNNREIKILLL